LIATSCFNGEELLLFFRKLLPLARNRADFDNAVAESFFATLETELLDQHSFRSRDQARLALFHWIEVFHNRRRHSALGMRTPIEYELINNNNTTTPVAA
jgi:transposase InsO family protein